MTTKRRRVSIAIAAVSTLTTSSFIYGLATPDAAKAADTPVTWFVEASASKPGQRTGHDAGHTNTKGKGHTENVSVVCPSRTDARPTVSTISGAIGCATAGDTVSVAAGTYKENPVVDKWVTIQGVGAIVDGSATPAPTVSVPAGTQTTISGLAIRNGAIGVLVNGDLTLTGTFEVDHNVGDGIQIASGALRTSANRPTLRSTGVVHDNGGNGVTIGTPFSGAAPAIAATLGDLDVFKNGGHGVFVRDDGGSIATNVVMLDNDIFQNAKSGLLSGRANIGQAVNESGEPMPARFAQNKFHSNGLNQVVFDGGGANWPFTIDSPTGMCDAGANGIYSYMGSTFGVFAQNTAAVVIRHTQWQNGGTGLMDFSAQSGSTISVAQNCTAITTTP